MGLLMAGSTLAFAATLADYPAPFVQNGQINSVIVVGASASPSDVVGAIDLAAGLASVGKESTLNVPSSAGSASISGEGVMLDTEGSKLYFGDSINKVRDVITSSDLPTLLKKSTFTDDDGNNYDYTQFIELGDNEFTFGQPDSGEDPVMYIQMYTNSAHPLYTEEVDFNKVVDFTATASKGQTLELFGKQYTVSADTTSDKLVLYGSAHEVSLQKGDEKTVELGGSSYDIKVIGFDSDKVVLSVNGNIDNVQEGHSKTIGGVKIYAKTVSSWDNGNQGVATLQLGSQKLTLENNEPVMVGDDEDQIDGTKVEFSGTPDALSSIKIKVFAKDGDHNKIKAGEKFEDPVFGTFDVDFAAVNPEFKDSSRDEIKLRTSGDHKAYVTFTDRYGNAKDVYFAYDNAGTISTTYDSDSTHKVELVEGAPAAEDEYIYLAPADDKRTHLVKVKNIHADDDGNADDYAEFYDVMSGATYKTKEFNYNASSSTTTTLTVDGKQYTVTFSSGPKVAVTYDDSKTVVYPAMEAAKGEDIALASALTGLSIANDTTVVLPTGSFTFINGTTASTVTVGNLQYDLTIDAANAKLTGIKVHGETNPGVIIKEEKDTANHENVVYIETSDNGANHKIGYAEPVFSGTHTSASTSSDDVTDYIDYYGTFAERDSSTSDQPIVTVYYPDNQMYFTAALLSSDATISTSGATSGKTITYNEAVPVTANIALLDSEVSSDIKASKNLILVGGPAVNSLVAELFASVYNLTPDENGKIYGAQLKQAGILQEGQALIQVFNDKFATGKTALVVAGYDAKDTRYACSVLQNYAQHKDVLTGEKAVLTTQ